MNTRKVIFVHSFLLLFWGLLLGFNTYSLPKSYQAAFLLPVNTAMPQGKCLNLVVEIPRGFRALPQPENATIHEFIPETDKDMYTWSQIITAQLFVGRGISAQYQTTSLKHRIADLSDTHVKIISESAYDYGTYTTATIIIAYANPMQRYRREIMLARYYSGPYDCSGFQYTIAIPDGATETDVVHKLQAFADTKTSLMKF